MLMDTIPILTRIILLLHQLWLLLLLLFPLAIILLFYQLWLLLLFPLLILLFQLQGLLLFPIQLQPMFPFLRSLLSSDSSLYTKHSSFSLCFMKFRDKKLMKIQLYQFKT